MEEEILPTCRELGVGFVPYSPLGRGLLTGTITGAHPLAATDSRAQRFPRFEAANLKKNLGIVKVIEQVAAEKKAVAAQVALAWLLHQGKDIVPIHGTKKRKWLEQNAGAATIALSADDLRRMTVQRFLNAKRFEEVVFVRGATEAINLVAQTWGDWPRVSRPRDTLERMLALAPALVLLLVAASGSAEPLPVAVITIGSDASLAGALQFSLEQPVGRAARLVPSVDLANPSLDLESAAAVVQRKSTEGLIDAAQKAFYGGQVADALVLLGRAQELEDSRTRVPVGERTTVMLWAIAARLAVGDASGAEAAARTLIAIDPAPRVDLNVFTPAVETVVSEAAKHPSAICRVALQKLPLSARLRVDGKDRVSPFSIPVGRHWVAIAAPGYRTLDRAIDVRFDVSIPMPLALALPGPSEAAISAMLTKGVAGPADMRGLRDIADRLGARGLVLASATPTESLAAIWWAGRIQFAPPVTRPPFEAATRLTEWTASAVAEQIRLDAPPRPLVRRPLFWAAVGAGMLAAAGAAVATSAPQHGSTTTVTGNGNSTLQWNP